MKFSICMKILVGVIVYCLCTSSAYAAMSDQDFLQICEIGSANEIMAAIEGGVNVNARNQDGETSLMVFLRRRAYKMVNTEVVEVIRTFIKAGADLNAQIDGGTARAIDWAVSFQSSPEVLKVLINGGADVKNSTGMSTLMRLLLRVLNPEVGLPLASLDEVLVIIKAGVDINARSLKMRNTALIIATALFYPPEIIKALLEAGADVNAQNNDGRTAFMFSAWLNEGSTNVRILVDGGADEKIEDNSGKRAIDYARKNIYIKTPTQREEAEMSEALLKLLD